MSDTVQRDETVLAALDEKVLAALEEPCKVAELEERLSKLSWLISVSTWFGDVYKRFKQVSGGLVGLK